jgi:hypothetical protein
MDAIDCEPFLIRKIVEIKEIGWSGTPVVWIGSIKPLKIAS